MSHGVLIPNAIAAMNIDSWNRSAVCASDVDNGNVVVLSAKSTTAGEGEVFTALVPSTANGLTGLWMAYEPEVVSVVSGSLTYKGLNNDPRNFYTVATKIFSVFKPALGDIVTMSADCLAGTFILNTTTHVNATDTTGGLKLLWGNSQTASVLSYKLLGVTYISIGTGAIDNQRVTAYQLECVGL